MARLRQREDGTYEAIFYDRDGTRKFKTTRTSNRRNAQAIADRYERNANDPDPQAENTTTLGEALRLMLSDRQALATAGKLAQGTVKMYTDKAGHLIRVFEMVGEQQIGFRLARLRAVQVDEFIETRRSEGASDHTIAKELVALRVALKLCKRRELWTGDIDAVMPHNFSAGYKPRERYLAHAELPRLLAQLTPDHAARVCFAIATSANRGEANRAQLCDVGDDAVFIRGTKTDSRPRVVPIVKRWQRDLIDFAKAHAMGKAGKLFAFDHGFDGALRNACVDAKLAHVCANDLRRTFAHWMRGDGVPIELLAPAMGHATTQMLQRVYGKLDARELATLMGRATLMPQRDAKQMDSQEPLESVVEKNASDSGAGGGTRTHKHFRTEDFESVGMLTATPREYKRKRKALGADATVMPQQDASVIDLAKRRA